MRIMHVIDSGGLYGAEKMLLSLAKEQSRLGLSPIIASIGETGEGEKPLEREARLLDVPVAVFRMMAGPNLFGAQRILHFARTRRTQLLHSHGYKGNILFGLLPGRLRGLPLISTLHGWTNAGELNRMIVYEAIDRLALRFVNAVVCVNEAMLKKPAIKRLPCRKMFVVNNGLPRDDVQPAGRREALADVPEVDSSIFNAPFTIGTIGRLSTEKGYGQLIEALEHVLANGINAKLVIIGEGPEYRRLRTLAQKLKLSDRVSLIGYRQDAARYMPLFDVYAISSLTEGLPITLLEAMQARTPVVATSVGGIPNVLNGGSAGILVNPSDPQSMAQGIIRIAKDKDFRTKLVKNAHARFVRDYSSKKMAEGYLHVYRKVIGA